MKEGGDGSKAGSKVMGRKSERAARQAREAKALRANLRRRKAQAQGRVEPGSAGGETAAE